MRSGAGPSIAMYLLMLVVGLLFWGVVGFVVWHFVAKYW